MSWPSAGSGDDATLRWLGVLAFVGSLLALPVASMLAPLDAMGRRVGRAPLASAD